MGLLRLHLWTPTTDDGLRPIALSANGRLLLTAPVEGRRVVHVLVPGSAAELELSVPTRHLDSDARALGVAVEALSWRALGLLLPALRQALVLPLITLALTLLLLRLSWSPSVATSISVAVGAVLAVGAVAFPLAVAPFTLSILVIVLLAHAGLLLWAALIRHEKRWWRLPRQLTPAALLLLLGIGYWMVWLYQWFGCETGASVPCPRAGTQMIGSVTLATLLAVVLVPGLSSSPTWRTGLVVLALSALAEAAYSAVFAFQRQGPDFLIHWRAVQDLRLGQPLYRLDELWTNHFGFAYKWPPLYAVLLLPLAALDASTALLVHRGVNLLLYVLSAGLLVRQLRPRLGSKLALVAVTIVMGLMQAPFDTLAYGQVDIILLALFLQAMYALVRRRAWLVGATIAIMGMIKLYPLLLVGFLAVRREWKALVWTAAFMLFCSAGTVAVLGWEPHVTYLTNVLPHIGGSTAWIENQTIGGFLHRLRGEPIQLAPAHHALTDLLIYASFLGIVTTTLLLAARPSERHSSRYALQLTSLVLVMVFAVPAAWMHYTTIILPGLLFLVWHAAEQPLPLGRAAVLGVAFGLVAYGNHLSFFSPTAYGGLAALALSYRNFGLVTLWVITLGSILPLRQAIAWTASIIAGSATRTSPEMKQTSKLA